MNDFLDADLNADPLQSQVAVCHGWISLTALKTLISHRTAASPSLCDLVFLFWILHAVAEMGAKTTSIIYLFLLVPIILLVIIVVVSVKCASGCDTVGHDSVNWTRGFRMRGHWWRCFWSRSRETGERSGSSANSIVEDNTDIEIGGDLSQIR